MHRPHKDHGWSVEEAIAVLESPERREALDPERFWDRVGLSAGETIADVGAGTGYFALPAARRVGATGTVHAIDLSTDLLTYIQDRAAREGLTNVRIVRAFPGRIPLPSGCVDLVLFANVLHDLSLESIAEALRLLRPRGRVVNLDWSDRAEGVGPPKEIRLSPEAAMGRFAPLGFERTESFEPGPYHYAGIFRRGPSSGPTRDIPRAPGTE